MITVRSQLVVLGKQLAILITFLVINFQSYSQCNIEQTISVCDMETIDFDNNSIKDGIINLYAEYTKSTGLTIQNGTWTINPKYATALDPNTGNVSTWILPNSTVNDTRNEYTFKLFNTTCGAVNPALTITLILGPYSGIALPRSGTLNTNAQGCDDEYFDLFTAFVLDDATPPPHQNGSWTYNGNSPNFIEFDMLNPSRFKAKIPYQQGSPIPDQEAFEFTYKVPGISPCSPFEETTVVIAIVRQVDSGDSKQTQICEDDILAGVYDLDINLRDDKYLEGEDNDNGIWLPDSDPTGQIAHEQDSEINLKTIYNDFVVNNGANLRFGCKEFSFTYAVSQRSGVCEDQETSVPFTFYEQLRPFSQPNPPPQICANVEPGELHLFDLLRFTTEGTFNFVYDSDTFTNWRLVSGSSSLGIKTLSDDNYTHLGTIHTLNAEPGTYVFEFGVNPWINCPNEAFSGCGDPFINLSGDCSHPCGVLKTLVTIEILPFAYAGEDTKDISLCESLGQVDLRSLLKSTGTNVIATTGVWTNSTGDIINNTFVFPDSDSSQLYTFTHTTTSSEGCIEKANLTFTIHTEPDAGDNGNVTVCSDNLTVTLFNILGGTPDPTGIWTGPFGYMSTDHLGIFDINDYTLPILGVGDYIYTVPGNDGCKTPDTATVSITIVEPVGIGNDRSETFCKIDGRVNLYSLLDRNTPRIGVFEDTDNTGALDTNGVLEFETLTNNIYNFRYVVPNTAPCDESSLNVAVQIVDLPIPNVPTQEFCILDAKKLEDIEVDVLNYNWYTTLESETPIINNPLLFDNQVYYIASIDANNCESERLQVIINILNTGEKFSNGELCTLDFQDGVSPNGDHQNDTFDLLIDEVYNIPEAFPDFELNIYNRYGSLVYEGNINTEEFRGESNISIRLGDDLPSGTYFYIFTPNFESNLPIQGSFYLSR
ncbi:gliding motility-associated C-terminal domain-containing protein [Aquimarina longa]|uniref:gliding motility-associated C-terminal domain-containing protein n=1 Tax=Aquimarina longa TaxID=1080221 RepID=UPI000ABB25EB|nr:gliding motility-associated C-terminal domain-containing protein [Aquimarina longa]